MGGGDWLRPAWREEVLGPGLVGLPQGLSDPAEPSDRSGMGTGVLRPGTEGQMSLSSPGLKGPCPPRQHQEGGRGLVPQEGPG